MTVQEFIRMYAQKIADSCNNADLLPSPSIAQAIIEGQYGNSELAVNANALFGIKLHPWEWQRGYSKVTKECYDNLNLIDVTAAFRAYRSWEESIADHTNFLLNHKWSAASSKKIYSNLVGIRDYREYCNVLAADGYATSPTYANTLISCIEKYGLTKYDVIVKTETESDKMIFNVHAGHNPDGKIACGAIGLIKESTQARLVKDEVISLLRENGHTVYDCTVSNGTSQSDVLRKIIAKTKEHSVNLDVSIHFNSGANDRTGNGITTGTEVWTYSATSKANDEAKRICEKIAALGYKNRGVKHSANLYVLKNTSAPALLIECCFVDDKDDVQKYDYLKMAKAIVEGLTGQVIKEAEQVVTDNGKTSVSPLYRVQCGAYSNKTNAEALQAKLKAAGFSAVITQA